MLAECDRRYGRTLLPSSSRIGGGADAVSTAATIHAGVATFITQTTEIIILLPGRLFPCVVVGCADSTNMRRQIGRGPSAGRSGFRGPTVLPLA